VLAKKPFFTTKSTPATPTHPVKKESMPLTGKILGKVTGGFAKNSPSKRLKLPPENLQTQPQG
jgi:hypothetical protein